MGPVVMAATHRTVLEERDVERAAHAVTRKALGDSEKEVADLRARAERDAAAYQKGLDDLRTQTSQAELAFSQRRELLDGEIRSLRKELEAERRLRREDGDRVVRDREAAASAAAERLEVEERHTAAERAAFEAEQSAHLRTREALAIATRERDELEAAQRTAAREHEKALAAEVAAHRGTKRMLEAIQTTRAPVGG